MPYVSELLGKPVADVDGARIGHLDDLIATLRGDVPHPVVTAIVVKRSRGNLIVPMSDVVVLDRARHSSHQTGQRHRTLPARRARSLSGARRAGQTDHRHQRRARGARQRSGTDARQRRFLRRQRGHQRPGPDAPPGHGQSGAALHRRSQRRRPTGTISWDEIELLSADQPMRLRVSSDQASPNCTPPIWPKSSATSPARKATSCSNRWTWKPWPKRWKKWSRNFRPPGRDHARRARGRRAGRNVAGRGGRPAGRTARRAQRRPAQLDGEGRRRRRPQAAVLSRSIPRAA